MSEKTREAVDAVVGRICEAVEIAFAILLLPLLAFFVYITLAAR